MVRGILSERGWGSSGEPPATGLLWKRLAQPLTVLPESSSRVEPPPLAGMPRRLGARHLSRTVCMFLRILARLERRPARSHNAVSNSSRVRSSSRPLADPSSDSPDRSAANHHYQTHRSTHKRHQGKLHFRPEISKHRRPDRHNDYSGNISGNEHSNSA